MNRFKRSMGRFAGMTLRGFRRPSRYRSNPNGIIRDNRQMRTGNFDNNTSGLVELEEDKLWKDKD
jgi:hypothetical protein